MHGDRATCDSLIHTGQFNTLRSEINHQANEVSDGARGARARRLIGGATTGRLTLAQVFAQIVFDVLIGAFAAQNGLVAHGGAHSGHGGSALYADHARSEMLHHRKSEQFN